MQSHIRKVYASLAVTCHLHLWQNDRDLLRATAVTRGGNFLACADSNFGLGRRCWERCVCVCVWGGGGGEGGGTIFFMGFRNEMFPVSLVSYPLAVDLYAQSATRTKLLLNI